jgi:hypothetical protein
MQNKSPIWKQVLQIIITILTAIGTTFGVVSLPAKRNSLLISTNSQGVAPKSLAVGL